MLCVDFETLLTDYIEGVVGTETNRQMAEHAMKCPVCHETLSAVKSTVAACRVAAVPEPSHDLDARILQKTVPETAMTCEEFEEFLTDYLDGFLPAHLYHRWERHAALCERCTELPGQVVRSIGACYTYISEEKPVPAGLHERILQATLGTVDAEQMRAPLAARIAARLRLWLDPLVSPQLATVATMLLICVLVLTNTVSADGSISGMYRAGIQIAERAYSGKSDEELPSAADSDKLQTIGAPATAGFQSNTSVEKQQKDKQKPETTTPEQQKNKQK